MVFAINLVSENILGVVKRFCLKCEQILQANFGERV